MKMKKNILPILGALFPYLPSLVVILFDNLHIDVQRDVYLLILLNISTAGAGLICVYFGTKDKKSKILKGIIALLYLIGVIFAYLINTIAWNIIVEGPNTLF